MAWGLGGGISALAGVLVTPLLSSLDTVTLVIFTIQALAAALVGRLQSLPLTVVGGLALGVFLNLVGQYVHFVTSELRLPFAFAVLLTVLLIKPTGLFGRARVRKV